MATWAPASGSTGFISCDDSSSQASLGGSETSDHSWFDDIALSAVCRLPAVESAAVSRLLDAYHVWSQTFATCHTTCAGMEEADAPDSSPPDNTPSTTGSNSSFPPSAETNSSTTLTPQDAPQKGGTARKRGWDDDDDEPKKPRAQKRKRVENGGSLLACPFHKRYHPKHFFCGKDGAVRGFKTIAQVKQHIRQFHIRPPTHCPICKTNFDDNQKLGEHIVRMVTNPCQERAFSDETMLPWSTSLVGSIKARVDSSLTLREQWFSVWRLLFPDITEPASCWVDEDACRHVLDIKRFVIAEGDRVVCISRFLPRRKFLWANGTSLRCSGQRSPSRKRHDSGDMGQCPAIRGPDSEPRRARSACCPRPQSSCGKDSRGPNLHWCTGGCLLRRKRAFQERSGRAESGFPNQRHSIDSDSSRDTCANCRVCTTGTHSWRQCDSG